MTRYYTNPGHGVGIWLGRGLPRLAEGAGLAAGSVITEEQMVRLFGAPNDPVTDAVPGLRVRHHSPTRRARRSRRRSPPTGPSPPVGGETFDTTGF